MRNCPFFDTAAPDFERGLYRVWTDPYISKAPGLEEVRKKFLAELRKHDSSSSSSSSSSDSDNDHHDGSNAGQGSSSMAGMLDDIDPEGPPVFDAEFHPLPKGYGSQESSDDEDDQEQEADKTKGKTFDSSSDDESGWQTAIQDLFDSIETPKKVTRGSKLHVQTDKSLQSTSSLS